MSIITPIKRYLPHELHTRIHAVKLYRLEHDISFVCRRYKVSKSSLLRWNKRYDGTPGSLMDRSHRPHTPHPSFIYPYMEQSSASTCDFIRRAILFFKYVPAIIQTDNGSEFTYTRKTDRIHPMDALCRKLCIEHKLIRPRTPRHNGKVERSHRNDQERFYNHLSFYSYSDLLYQMSNYLYRSNRIPSRVLGWLTPEEMTKKLMPISSPRKAPQLPENIMDFIYGDVSV